MGLRDLGGSLLQLADSQRTGARQKTPANVQAK